MPRVLLLVVIVFGATACARRCELKGMTHAPGTTFPGDDGCNSCTCTSTGEVACTLKDCRPGDAGADAARCDFATTYVYGVVGGMSPITIQSELAPGNRYRHERLDASDRDGGVLFCTPSLPPCGALDVITAYDIEVHDLPHPDVQRALAQAAPPLYGRDPRPVDGVVFSFRRADGRGFLVGDDCGDGSCPIPPGVARLEARLRALDAQQTRDPGCRAVVP
jgi:hypothetical protein